MSEATMKRCCFLLIVVTAVYGCGSADLSSPVPVYPVRGTVTYQGEPVVGADVTFINAESDYSAFGRTNDAGEYQLTSFSANDGAAEGRYAVTIAKIVAPTTSTVADVESEAYQPPGFNESTDPVPTKSSVPAKYQSQETSGLIAVVNAKDSNQINFDLTD
jgi:hypothetical protein